MWPEVKAKLRESWQKYREFADLAILGTRSPWRVYEKISVESTRDSFRLVSQFILLVIFITFVRKLRVFFDPSFTPDSAELFFSIIIMTRVLLILSASLWVTNLLYPNKNISFVKWFNICAAVLIFTCFWWMVAKFINTSLSDINVPLNVIRITSITFAIILMFCYFILIAINDITLLGLGVRGVFIRYLILPYPIAFFSLLSEEIDKYFRVEDYYEFFDRLDKLFL